MNSWKAALGALALLVVGVPAAAGGVPATQARLAVRNFVEHGSTAIMTAYSDKADATGQWYGTPLPGGLADVFGLKTNQFYNSEHPLTGTIAGGAFGTSINSYEVLEPTTARIAGRFTNVDGLPPASTFNRFGRGVAIYVATTAQPAVLGPLYRSLYKELGIERGPQTPPGVVAREVDGRTLYANTRNGPVTVPLSRTRMDLLTGRRETRTLDLAAFGVAFLQ